MCMYAEKNRSGTWLIRVSEHTESLWASWHGKVNLRIWGLLYKAIEISWWVEDFLAFYQEKEHPGGDTYSNTH